MRLFCHPDTSCPWITGIDGKISPLGFGLIRLEFTMTGEMARLKSAPTEDPLWKHTCFEAFFRPEGQKSYTEFNFNPSGQWARYEMSAYREPGPEKPASTPQIEASITPHVLTLTAQLALPAPLPLLVGLSAVIEDRENNLSCWALNHPPGKPDFHHDSNFVLNLAA